MCLRFILAEAGRDGQRPWHMQDRVLAERLVGGWKTLLLVHGVTVIKQREHSQPIMRCAI